MMTSVQTPQANKVDLTWLKQYRHITVIGLGMSGVGVVKALTARGIELHIQDSRKNVEGLEDLKLLPGVKSVHTGSFDKEALLKTELIILSPGVSMRTPEIDEAIRAGVCVTGDIDIVARSTSVPIIAITGSNGKSTVTKLAGDICEVAGYQTFVGGNIGRSAMELLDSNQRYEVAILELSSFQLETTPELNALSAVVLNLSPDHLDRYDSYQEYAESKLAIFNGAQACVLNRDDSWLSGIELFSSRKQDLGRQCKKRVVSFGVDEPKNDNEYGLATDEKGTHWLMKGNQRICSTDQSSLLGVHNHMNILAALALLDSFGIGTRSIEKALSSFIGLPHRMQVVREHKGVVWINDSKATNVGATMAAIAGLNRQIILLAGGQGKGADFDELVPLIGQYVRKVYLFGEDAKQMKASWCKATDCYLVDSLSVAVVHAEEVALSGECVLFAPACASFDMFPSFVARGEYFIELVDAL